MRIELNKAMRGVQFDISIPEGVFLFGGDSSTGKSYLLSFLSEEYEDISSYVNYVDVKGNKYDSTNRIKSKIDSTQIALLDNADLYMTQDLYDYVKLHSKIVLIAARDMFLADYSGAHFADVDYDGKKMEVVIYDYCL